MWSSIKEWHINTKLLFVFTLLNVPDFLTTKVLVDRDGYIAELNPILIVGMEIFDSVYFIFWAKFLVLAAVWLVYSGVRHKQDLPRQKGKRLTYALTFGCMLYAVVVIANLLTIAGLR